MLRWLNTEVYRRTLIVCKNGAERVWGGGEVCRHHIHWKLTFWKKIMQFLLHTRAYLTRADSPKTPHPEHLPPSHTVCALLHVVTFLSMSPQPGWKAPVINSYDLFIFVSPMSGIKALVQEMFIDPNWNKISGGKIICIFLISLLYQFSSFTSSSVAGSSGSRSEKAKPRSRDKRDHQWEKTEQLWDRQT